MISIPELKNILSQHYKIEAGNIVSMEPGWAALAYKVNSNDDKTFFLKVYDKKRSSIAYILDAVPVYLFFINWLNSNTLLKGKITELVNVKNGALKVEDEDYIYIVMEYLEGNTVGEGTLSNTQVRELADIVAQLHGIFPPVSGYTESITEKFILPWLLPLKSWFTSQFETLKPEIREVLIPYLSCLNKQIRELEIQSVDFSKQNFPFVLCHTDIHTWNIIADEDKIHLIDWEGLKYAPAEADIFGLYDESYFPEFLEQYKISHPSYEINRELLKYYTINRNLTDIWEGIEQLQFDELSTGEFQEQIYALQEVCKENDEVIKLFL